MREQTVGLTGEAPFRLFIKIYQNSEIRMFKNICTCIMPTWDFDFDFDYTNYLLHIIRKFNSLPILELNLRCLDGF